ncbi:MAG TPA: cupin domain-containing protein [Burkholderiaceae bacterium]
MKTLSVLGSITPAQFMRDYWHKKPLLIRQAIPGFQALLPLAQLQAMVASDDVESRLVTHFDGEWDMQQGPFETLPATHKSGWTLLAQGMNLHDCACDELLRRFRFIPDARLDDLMISYATDGGGVGPHFDSYDVFLLQAHGQRRWRIGAQNDLTLRDDMPLKILAHFAPTEEYVLEPGDMLYLPPHYAHDGVAVGECMTYSIGFRSPSYQELGEAFLQWMADSIDLPGRYEDPDLKPAKAPAEIPQQLLRDVAREMNKVRFTADDVALFLGEYLSEPKHNVYFTPVADPLTPEQFDNAAGKCGVALSRKTQMLYRGTHLFINGESFELEPEDQVVLAELANRRVLDGAALHGAGIDVMEALYAWYHDGWLALREAD